jgi:hypothetical protein
MAKLRRLAPGPVESERRRRSVTPHPGPDPRDVLTDQRVPSPHICHYLAMGRPASPLLPGWVEAEVTGGRDHVSDEALIAVYGASVRALCQAAGFDPAFHRALSKQSPEARLAATQWARQFTADHRRNR